VDVTEEKILGSLQIKLELFLYSPDSADILAGRFDQ
jgi:hypothetical protein